MDTGIYAAHSDFENRVTAGFTSITDGRGSNDCNGHGTHVAGTIGGKNYGVAKTVTLIPGANRAERLADKMLNAFSDFRLDVRQAGKYFARIAPRNIYE